MFYGYVLRYHFFSGNRFLKSSFKEFFGTENNSHSVLFPYDLNACLKILGISDKEYLENHSVMPFYRLFLQEASYKRICKEVFHGERSYTSKLLEQQKRTSKIKSDRLHYCPECIKENRDYSSLKIFHQVKGVYVCPKHHCYLNSIPVSRAKKILNMEEWDMEVKWCEQGGMLEQIAEDVEYIIAHPPGIDNRTLREQLFDEAFFRGAWVKGKVQTEAKNNEWKRYYDHLPTEYSKYKSGINFKRFADPELFDGIEPIEYLLFIRSLFGGFERFMKTCVFEEDLLFVSDMKLSF